MAEEEKAEALVHEAFLFRRALEEAPQQVNVLYSSSQSS